MENLGYKEGSAKPLRRQRVARAASVAMCESGIGPLSAQQRYVFVNSLQNLVKFNASLC